MGIIPVKFLRDRSGMYSAAATASTASTRTPGKFSSCDLAVVAILFNCNSLYGRALRDSKGSRVFNAVRRRIRAVDGVENRCAFLRRNAYLNGTSERAAVGCDNRSVKRRKIPDGYIP